MWVDVSEAAPMPGKRVFWELAAPRGLAFYSERTPGLRLTWVALDACSGREEQTTVTFTGRWWCEGLEELD